MHEASSCSSCISHYVSSSDEQKVGRIETGWHGGYRIRCSEANAAGTQGSAIVRQHLTILTVVLAIEIA